MKIKTISLLAFSLMALGAWADNVQGIIVEYVGQGTNSYQQALSTIGKISFTTIDEAKHAVIVFKDQSTEDQDLGPISEISKIAFGAVSESGTPTDVKSVVADAKNRISVQAYPNPTSNHISIKGAEEGQTIRLFSADGKVIYSGTNTEINLGSQASGLYILQVGKELVKIIKK